MPSHILSGDRLQKETIEHQGAKFLGGKVIGHSDQLRCERVEEVVVPGQISFGSDHFWQDTSQRLLIAKPCYMKHVVQRKRRCRPALSDRFQQVRRNVFW